MSRITAPAEGMVPLVAEVAKSVLTLTTGGSISSPETPDEIKKKAQRDKGGFIEIADLIGETHFVSVDQIVEIAGSGL